MNEVFQASRMAMDQAREEQSIKRFRESCMALGFQETDDGRGITIRYSYKLLLPDGIIEGSLRAYDQSGPFQILSDMNKIEMVHKRKDTEQERYYVEWED